MPRELGWVVVMQEAGGYRDFLALMENARDLDDVLIMLEGKGEAAADERLAAWAKGDH